MADETVDEYTGKSSKFTGTDAATEQLNVSKQALDSSKKIEGTTEKTNETLLKGFTASGLGGALGTIAIQGVESIKDTFNLLGPGLQDSFGNTIENMEALRAAYGGLETGASKFEFVPTSAVSAAVRRFRVVEDAFAGLERKTMGMEKTGKEVMESISSTGINIVDAYFGGVVEDVQQKVENILTDLSTTYGNQVANLSDEAILKMSVYEDALGVSTATIQNLFQKQIGFTGEISTDTLDKIGGYAKNLSDQIGVPMKTLTDMTLKMMTNTEMFGDITDVEATRMSAKLTQLGYTFEELSSVQNKFASFSSAAQAAGTISQLTGAQVDSMRMSYLASEGRFDELIEYQRDSLIQAGMTKEKFLGQSNSMKNAIAKAFGRSQEELAYLLDSERRISSQEELDELMGAGEVSEQEGFDALLGNLKQTKLSFDEIEDTLKGQTRKLLVEKGEEAILAAERLNTYNAKLRSNFELLGTSQESFNKVTDGHMAAINKMTSIDPSNMKLGEFTKSIAAATTAFAQDVLTLTETAKQVQTNMNDLGIGNSNVVNTVVEESNKATKALNDESKKSIRQTKDILAALTNGTLGAKENTAKLEAAQKENTSAVRNLFGILPKGTSYVTTPGLTVEQ